MIEPSETNSSGTSSRRGDHSSSSLLPSTGPTKWNDSSNVSSYGWNSRGTNTMLHASGASIVLGMSSSTS